MSRPCIAIDAMGGDFGPPVVVPAALEFIRQHQDVQLILVGDEPTLRNELQRFPSHSLSSIQIKHASQQILMEDPPSVVLRGKKDSSMHVALRLVRNGQADACVSAGNTGALMVIARFLLKTLPGVDRPAIIYSLPTQTPNGEIGAMRMLDLGANVDCTAEHLFQFAIMGSVLSEAIGKKGPPKVGLLNIGAEAIKGSEVVKKAANLIAQNQELNYIGYVEGTDIYQGKVDVVVCDGFVGNVALKSSEGVARMLIDFLKIEFTKNPLRKAMALMAYPVLKQLKNRFEPSGYNGASLLGLNGIVIKSHGNAKQAGFVKAIEEAQLEIKSGVLQKIHTQLENILIQPECTDHEVQ